MVTQSSSDLLPCPFCGSPADLTRFERGDGKPAIWITQIQCSNDDNCSVCVDIQHINEVVAVKAWNTRTPAITGQGEAVAWRWQKPFGPIGEWQITKEKPTNAFRMLEPLYIAPQIAGAARLDRDTVSQIVAGAIEASDRGTPDYTIQAREAADAILALSSTER